MSSESNQSSGATTPALSPLAAIDDSFKELLKALRHPEATEPRKKRGKVAVEPEVFSWKILQFQQIQIRSNLPYLVPVQALTMPVPVPTS
ncbi:hypothetical protein JTB14_005943 [Gonioctena quinquepunctata]|nr:hypothetical protein JTB14_005943 [Gonioctena quinquepunctata]